MRAGDTVRIRLPEGLVVTLEVAGVGSRGLALILDTLLLLVAAGLVTLGLNAAGWLTTMAGLAVAAVTGTLFFGGYGFLGEWLGGGATPGKRVAGLVVLRADGRPPDVWTALVRNVLRVVDFLPGFYAVGIGSALASRDARRLGDWAAGTLVVHMPRVAGPVAPGARGHPPLPLPAVRSAGPLPPPEAMRALPSRVRRDIRRLWERAPRGGAAASPEWTQQAGALLAEVGGGLGLEAGALARPVAALEHLAAGLERAGLWRNGRWSLQPARDRSRALEARAPDAAGLDRLPPPLADAVLAFWTRRAGLETLRRAAVARTLAARLAEALDAPGLDSPDPDALVEHVAHLLGRTG